MKTKITRVITFAILLFLHLIPFKVSIAVTAYPYPFKFKQPDGSVLTIQLKGDEKVHWAETMDGFTLLNNGKDGWEYATPDSKGDIKCSGILAREPQFRSAAETDFLKKVPKQVKFSQVQISMIHSIWDARASAIESDVFNPNGNKNLVMILIGYTDLAFTKTQADFDALMNQVGYNLNGAVGSVKDFFLQNSYNQFNITTTVAGPYTAAHDMAYYGANDPITGDDINSNALITEAVYLADPDVNYADFDNDGDGGVDGVYVIYAGYGEADGGSANSIWPHAGGIPTVTLDGKAISKYSCSNELRGGSGTNMTTIGVICHEFGHVCGSPDYYDTDYATSGQYDGTGSWDLMAGGSWNGSPAGSSPPHMMPIDKIRNTWITPIQLTTDASISLSDITTNPVVYRFNTATSNEYYLIENRQKTGFNSAIPGHGLMIYHVDGNYISTAGNCINCTSHQGMFPLSAIATNSNGVHTSADNKINKSGCPWPGTSAKTTFTDATTPNAKDWAGNNTNGALINIAEAGGVINLCYKTCPPINPVFNLIGASPNGSQIDLSWIKNAANNDVIIAWNSTDTFGDPTNGSPYNVNDVLSGGGTILYKGQASSFSHSGLSPSTTYYYKIWSVTSTPNYSAGTLANAQTLCASVATLPFIEGFEGGVIPGCWTQSNVIGANPWTIATSGTNSHPAGPHSGTYLARCRTTTVGAGYVTKLISPPINLTGITNPVLKFWHTQDKDAVWTGPDILRIYYRTSGTSAWNELAIYNSQIAAWTAETINLPNPTANYFIAFEATVNAGYGVCIDDIRISSPVADFTADGNLSCTGSLTVNFTDNSLGPNGSWAWDVDNNGTTDYTTQNPTHTYSIPGLYSVKLTINSGGASILKENLILVMASQPTVNTGCSLTTNSNNGNTYGIGIYRFALGNIDYTTSNNDGYYSNYTCSKWTQLELNTSYNITLRTGTANNEGAKVYIDYNDNGTFEPGEAVISFPANKDGTRTLSFTTPSAGVVFNKGLRLRVLSKFGSVPSTACDISTYGQAEDYTVYFKNNTYTITASAGANGTISPSGVVSVTSGANQTFNIAANACYQIADVLVDGVSQGAISTYSFTNVTAAHTISATFSQLTYSITASAGAGGIISPTGLTVVNCGASQSFNISADACYQIADVLVDGISQGAISTYTFTNVTASHTISATFSLLTYTITASAGAGGNISPTGATVVNCGSSQTYNITADGGYDIQNVLVDGVSQGAIANFTFNNVTTIHTIYATFVLANKSLIVKAFLEGLYETGGVMRQAHDNTGPHFGSGIADQLTIELHEAANYANIVYSSGLVDISTGGLISISVIPANLADSYYITVRHRNSIETTSAAPVSFSGSTINYDFSTTAISAFGNNMADKNGVFVIYGGDINQDGIVDAEDMISVDNAAGNFYTGYIDTDTNGDGFVDSGDMIIPSGNSAIFVARVTP